MKKRLLSLFLCFCILLPLLSITPLASAAPGTLYGDADDDRDVDLQDVLLIEKYLAGEAVDINATNADVNGDGQITKEDSQMIRDYLAGNLVSLTPDLCTVTFQTDGGGELEPISVGKGYPIIRELPTPAKDGFLFTGWLKADGSAFTQEDVVTVDTVLTASYEAMQSTEQLHVDSFALTDQSPDVSFQVKGSGLSADAVKALLTVIPKDGSDPVEIEVLDNGGGIFTVKAKESFTPAASYELTLGEGLTFVDKDEQIRKAEFIIRKAESDHIYYNENLIFIQDTDAMTYTVAGDTTPKQVLEADLLNNDKNDEDITGSFTMPGGTLKADDLVCIFETVDPRNRDYTKNNYDDDSIAYLRITAVNGSVFSFESLDDSDAKDILMMPDSIPFHVTALPAEGNGTVNRNDYDAAARAKLGFTEVPEYLVGDFLIFYTADFETADADSPVRYGQVTKVEGDIVSYKTVSKDYIDSFMGMFVSTGVSGEEILEGVNQQAILNNVQLQAMQSGFVDEATQSMLYSAMLTQSVQNQLLANGLTQEEIESLAAEPVVLAAGDSAGGTGGTGGASSSNRATLTVESTSVQPTFFIGKRFKNGIGLRLDIRVVLSVDKKVSATKTNSLKIELSAGFEQQIAVGVDINVEDQWKWYAFIPVLKELSCYTSVDIQSYSSVSVGAKIYTTSDEEQKATWAAVNDATASPEIQSALRQLNKLGVLAKKAQAALGTAGEYLDQIEDIKAWLPKVSVNEQEYSLDELEKKLGMTDVSSEFEDVLGAEGEDENKVGLEKLMDKYVDMLQTESSWIELYNKPLFEKEFHIKVIAIKVSVNFVVRANVNISLGADVEYQVGKRYNFWVHIISRSSGSSEMDLLDERFGFQFYVMGALGLKIGIKAEVAVGFISTKLGSIGASVEFGPYLRIYGYFFYIYTKMRPANTTQWQETQEMAGAMYLEFGLYVTVKFKAQVFDNTFKYEPTLYDGEFPLLTAGVQQNVYDFATQPNKEDILYIQDTDANSQNGITMGLPSNYRLMKSINLRSGDRLQNTYDLSQFNVRFSSNYFSMDSNGVITVKPPEGSRFLKCNMTLTWKCDKLAFSKYDIDITVPVVWTNYSQSEMTQKFTASVAVGNPTDGYQTVWSDRYTRANTFDLPSQEEILGLLNYDSYNYNGMNLKYSAVDGYAASATTGLSITGDTVYYFNITPRTYTLNVTGIQKPDGSTETRTFTTTYGNPFELSSLAQTGANNRETNQYSSFLNLTQTGIDKAVFEPDTVTDLSFFKAFGTNGEVTANYTDDALTATYTFLGIEAPSVTVKFRKGDIPFFESLTAYVEAHGGEGTVVTGISPVVSEVTSSVQYTVSCMATTPAEKHLLSFETNGGSTIKSQEYPAGSMIFRPTDPIRAGYTFGGWYLDPAFAEPFSFAGAVMPEQDTTVYAKWSANSYTVTFNSRSTTIAQLSVTYDSPYGTLPSPAKETEFKFVGWYTELTGGKKIDSDSLVTITQDITLYAHWEEKAVIDLSSTLTFTKQQITTYTGNAQKFAFTLGAPYTGMESSFIVSYKSETAGAEWTTETPVNTGTYLMQLSRPMDDDYKALNPYDLAGATLRINKASLALTSTAQTMGGTVAISYPSGYKGDGTITYVLQKIQTVRTEKKQSTNTFTNVVSGNYSCWVSVAEGTNYLAATTPATDISVEGVKSGEYDVQFVISTADETGAGTDCSIYGSVVLSNGLFAPGNTENPSENGAYLNNQDGAGNNAFERGETETYDIISNIVPWQIAGYGLYKKNDYPTAGDWIMSSLVIRAVGPESDDKFEFTDSTRREVNGQTSLSQPTSFFLRHFTSTDNFQTGGADSINLSDTSGMYQYSYSGLVSDQYYSNYNAWQYYDPPTFSVTSGNWDYDRFIQMTGITSFTIDKAGLAAYMQENGGTSFAYTVSLVFSPWTVHENNCIFTKTIQVTAPAAARYSASAPSSGRVLAAYATNTATEAYLISADDVSTMRGQTFELPVRLSGNPSVWGVWSGIEFDQDAFELIGSSAGSVFDSDFFTQQKDLTKESFRFLATSSTLSNTSANGNLITLKFRVKEQAKEQKYEIKVNVLQSINASGEVQSPQVKNSFCTVGNGGQKTDGTNTGGNSTLPLLIALLFISSGIVFLAVFTRKRKTAKK